MLNTRLIEFQKFKFDNLTLLVLLLEHHLATGGSSNIKASTSKALKDHVDWRRFDRSSIKNLFCFAAGDALEVSQARICDDELILIKDPKVRTAASIILRGPNDFYCDEMERSVHDSLCVVKRVMESKNVVVGGGTVEAALSIYLETFATTIASR